MSTTLIIVIAVAIVFLFLLIKAFKFAIKLLLWAIVLAAIYWVVAPMVGWTPLPDVLESRGLPVPSFMERDHTIPPSEVPVVDPAAPPAH